jgi:iron complex transport system permease protein
MRRLVWPILVVLLVLSIILGVSLGPVPVPMAAVWGALTGSGDATTLAIVRAIRLPRVILGVLVGAGLGMSGAALQGSLRNPLAEPYLLGVSGGAAVGSVIAMAFGAPPGGLPLAAFAGAIVAVVLVLAVARAAARRADPRVLLMAGVVVGAFANAAIMLMLATAPPNAVRNALWWMMGSLADATWTSVGWLAIYASVGCALLIAIARDVDLLALGDEAAAGLGLDVEKASRRVYLLSALVAAATVAGAGLVGFVGLVVPNLARALVGYRARSVFVAAALVGGILLVFADLAARTLRAPTELPLGAVTAVIGVPFFLLQLRKYA